MKIFLISNLYPSEEDPDYGIFVRNIQNSLEVLGAEITGKAVIEGRSRSVSDKIKKYIKFYSGIISNYRKGNFDLIYLHFLSHSSPGLWLAKILFGKKKKLVVNIHGSDIMKYNKGFFKFTNKKILRDTDLIIIPSGYFKNIVKEKFPHIKDENLFVSPSGGIDPAVFYSTNRQPENKKTHLGFVSRLEEDKGLFTFLKALLILKNKSFPFRASIAGAGTRESEMKEFIKENALENEVIFLGVCSQKELNILYNDLDLFIFPTLSSESLGLVGLEAMACSTPVIGSEIAGLKTFLEDKKNGFFFPPGNENELAEKISAFSQLSEEEKDEMKKEAVKTAANYNRKEVANNLHQKLLQLLS